MAQDWEKPFLLQRWEYARDRRNVKFDSNAKENYGYYDGTGHWTEAEMGKLQAEERPITSLNYTFKAINTMVGNEIQNRNDIHVFPMEDGDVQMANLLNIGYKFVKANNKLDWKFTQANMDGYIASQGWIKNIVTIDQQRKPQITILNKNPLMIYFDPDSIELDLEDCNDIYESQFIFKKKLIQQFPGKKEHIERFYSADLDDHDLYIDRQKELVRVLYAEYKQYERKPYWAVRSTEGVIKFFPEEPDKDDVPDGATVRQYSDVVPVVYGTRMLGDVVLEDPVENPYGCGRDKFSYSLFCPYFVKGTGISAIDQFKSIQDIINKSYAQALDIMNRQPKVGGLYEKGAIEDPEDLNEISRSGKWLEVENLDKVLVVDPPSYPGAHMNMVKDSVELLKEIIGTPEVFLGEAPGRIESGLGVQILRRQAGLSFEMPADNFRVSQIEVGRKILNQMIEFWGKDKFMRIAGDDGNVTELKIDRLKVTKRVLDRQTGEEIPEETISITNRLKEGKYDFVIDVNQPSVTQRMYNQLVGIQLFQLMPRPELAPLVIDLLDFPKKEEWKAALSQAAQQMQTEGGQATGNPVLDGLLGGTGSPPPQGL